MGYDIFFGVEDKKDEPLAVLNLLFCEPINTCYSVIHVVVLRPPRIDWSILGGFILSELEPYISEGHPPLIHCDGRIWKCHIPYLYSALYAKELDDVLLEDKERYDRLSIYPGVMLRGEEFNALLQKLTTGIKDRLISLGCTIFHDFNEKETEE